MKEYRKTQKTMFRIKYHIIFCPRYRRKIFLNDNVVKRFKELVKLRCKELNISIIAVDCTEDHAYMLLDCPPTMSPSEIVHHLKSATQILLTEFDELSKMQNLWTRNYFISTNETVSEETINDFVESQKKRY